MTKTEKEMNLPTKISLHELQSCQFSSWYPTFRNLSKHEKEKTNKTTNDDDQRPTIDYPHNNVTIKSVIIKPLSDDFLEYLKSDGVRLPIGAEKLSSFLPDEKDENDVWSSDDDEDGAQKDNDDDSINDMKSYHFPILNEQIKEGINSLGGSAVPKLNWSAPKDVTWLNASTMKCSTVGDIFLMIKSSDFCMHDLLHAFDDVIPDEFQSYDDAVGNMDVEREDIEGDKSFRDSIEYELVLRKWSNLHPSMEFRCFVKNYNLVAISQRNHSQYYPHLKREYMTIRSHIIDLFEDVIHHNYADKKIPNYTFDVYIDKNNRVWLIDFNVWSVQTDSLLFTWEELAQLKSLGRASIEETDDSIISAENINPEIRVVQTENEVQYDPLSSYRGPVDAVHLATDEGTSESFQEFMNMCEKPSNMREEE